MPSDRGGGGGLSAELEIVVELGNRSSKKQLGFEESLCSFEKKVKQHNCSYFL